jgi:hypothetical protein
MPWFFCILRALPPSGPLDGVHLCLLERSVSGPSLPVISPSESLRSWWCRWSCSLFTAVRGGGATLWGLVLFRHCSASRIFIMQPGCSPPPVAIQKDDHQPRGGEKQARLRLPPQLQLQGCSSSSLEWRASQVGGPPPAWAGDPLLPPAFGEGCSPALRRRRTSAMRGRLATGCQLQRAQPFGLDGIGAASDAASCHLAGGVAVRPPHGRRSRRAQVATSIASPARRPHWGVVQDVVRCGSGGRALGWSCPHSRGRTGARTPSCVLRQPPPTGAEVGAVVGAEVVVAVGEATHCKGGCLRRRDRQSHLPPSPRLFGFNGLVVTPP